MAGRTLLHYKVSSELGSGEMGVVYEAVVNSEELQFWVHTIELDDDPSMRLNAGQEQIVSVTLSTSMALLKDMVVPWRRNPKTIGSRVVLDG